MFRKALGSSAWLVALAACAWIGVAAPLAAQSAVPGGTAASPAVASGAESSVLQPGDMVRITVWRKPELSGEFEVLPNGGVGNPYYMEVPVTGVPLLTATARIRDHIAQIESNPSVLVEPLYRVAIGGEVRRPDMYLLSPQLTVMQALIQAGGLTERARRDRLRIYRGGTEVEWEMSRAYAEPLHSGDQIFVDRQRSLFREYFLPALGAAGSIASILRYFR
jgi:protein involved in polysaccharide export with SLBB domain